MKNSRIAWYLDEDVLLEGTVIHNRFYPDTDKCGFHVQAFDADMVDTEIFFDLDKARSVCGDIPVIRKEEYVVIFDHQIVAVNRRRADNEENSIVYKDADGSGHVISLERCARNYKIENPDRSANCVGERNIEKRCFVFYTSGIKTKIIFQKKYVWQTRSGDVRKYKLLTGERTDRFHQFQTYLNETRYVTLDLS